MYSYEDFRISLGKAANFSEQFYGPVAGALARKNSLIWDLQNVPFDLATKLAHGEGRQLQMGGVETATAVNTPFLHSISPIDRSV